MSQESMLRFQGSDGSLFEMQVMGYEFPNRHTEEYDSNWLLIGILVAHSQGRWNSVSPCLLTYELKELADWFEAIALATHVTKELSFTEPCLWFKLRHVKGEAKSLRVYFGAEFRPTWTESEQVSEQNVYVEFPLSQLDLARAAEQLRLDLAQYPQRAVR